MLTWHQLLNLNLCQKILALNSEPMKSKHPMEHSYGTETWTGPVGEIRILLN